MAFSQNDNDGRIVPPFAQSPSLTRRRFITAAAWGAVAAPASQAGFGASGTTSGTTRPSSEVFVSGVLDRQIAAKRPGEGFGAAAFTAAGSLVWQTQLPARSHGQASHPSGKAVAVFARRPGDYLAILAAGTGKLIKMITPPAGRVFQGHGCYSPDGQFLYTSENAFTEGSGMIGVYNSRYERVREFASGGIGPHEILWLPSDGGLLAVANGGILTHPDFPRKKLNLESMASEITLINPRSGALQQRFKLPATAVNQQLSLRHMALHPSGRQLAIAAQHQQKDSSVPLLYTIELKSSPGLRARLLPPELQAQMKGYCGSVAYSPCGDWLYGSSPKGGLMVALQLKTGAAAQMALADGCGIASSQAPSCAAAATAFTSGSGAIIMSRLAPFPSPKKMEGSRKSLPLHFDNHVRAHALGHS